MSIFASSNITDGNVARQQLHSMQSKVDRLTSLVEQLIGAPSSAPTPQPAYVAKPMSANDKRRLTKLVRVFGDGWFDVDMAGFYMDCTVKAAANVLHRVAHDKKYTVETMRYRGNKKIYRVVRNNA